ncbi:MAG: OmpA family protein [Pseudomonadota bacterium]
MSRFAAWRRAAGTWVARGGIALVAGLVAMQAHAIPLALDWDVLAWDPEGQTNLEEMYTVDGRRVTVTFGGNTSGLDNQGTLSPRLGITNTGGLVPPESSLIITTDYPVDDQNRQVTVTIDLSDFPGGVEDVLFTVFDIDNNQSFVDVVTVTAVANGSVVNPTAIIPGAANILTSPNTVEGRQPSPTGSADANAQFEFGLTGITEIRIVYANGGPTNNAGLQTISLHDVNFNFQQADLSLTKTVDNPTPPASGNVVYTVTLTNDGPDEGTGLEVTDQLPSGLTYVSDNGGGAYDPVTGIWTVGTLAAGASTSLEITASINATGDYVNVAELTAANELDPDSTPGNNDPNEDDQDSATITPTFFADLSLTKVVDDDEPVFGQTVTYTLALTNDGPVDATGVTVSDPLPSGLSFVGATPSVGTYDPATGIWTVGDIAAGVTETLLLQATVLPAGDYANVAEVATSNEPDPDSTPGNNDPTEDDQGQSTINPPAIGAAKAVSAGPINNGDGTFTLTYDILASNFGTVPLSNLQVTDDLSAAFATATSFTVDSVSAPGFTVNPNFDGAADINLLAGTDTLPVGGSALIAVQVTITPGTATGPFLNQATASGVGPGGTPVTDDSQSGVNPDPDSDGDPGNNNDPTPVSFAEGPIIGLAKAVSDPITNNGDGTFSFDYVFVIQNVGDVVLSTIQVVDRLTDTFAGADSFTVDGLASTDFTVNPNYDGDTDINLLAGTDTLAVGGSGTVTLSLTVTPGDNLGPYENTGTASGLSPAGTPVTDISTAGTQPDPDNDGDPGNNSTPTPVTFTENPQIGVAKAISFGPVNNGDGTFALAYQIFVENSGDVTLSNVQVTDDLSATFAGADEFVIDNVTSGGLTLNPAYDGINDTNLLAGTDTLAVGGNGTITINLTVTPGSNLGPYNNTAIAEGTSPSNTVVQDVSANGVNPDPDNDGDPGNNSDPTPVTFGENPGIGTAKVVSSGPVDNNNGSFTLAYTIVVENTGDVILNNLQVQDDLSETYAGAGSFVVNGIESVDLTVNTGYDGQNDINLLAGTDTLAIAERRSVTVTVTVVPGTNPGPYLNTAIGQGTSPSGGPVQDPSTEGTDVDPDNDGDPSNNNDPTPVTFSLPILSVTKSAQPAQVTIGGIVRYTITIQNSGGAPFFDLTLVDQTPAGFTYVSGSERLSNGLVTVTGERPVLFSGINVAAGETVELSYLLRVGAGVTPGTYANTVVPTRNGTPVGEPATASVQVIADPDTEQTTIIGKVFADFDEDGYQDEDEGEYGIPGVRLATVEGLIMETDAYGRYHIAGVDGGFFERGRNFIVKVDPATLPKGAVFTTENPRVKRITQGLMNRFDFGVGLPREARDRVLPIRVKLAEIFFLQDSAEVRPEYASALRELADRLVDHGGGRLFIEGNDVANCQVRAPDVLSTKIDSESFVFVPRFGIRKAVLTSEDRDALADLVARWQGAEDVRLISIGHTSSVRIAPENRAEFADNYVLGQARAQTVANYLVNELGLDVSQSTVESRGPDEPVADNGTREGRAKNRRVELTISGRRIVQQTLKGLTRPCDPGLAERRANAVFEKLREQMGDERIQSVEIVVGPYDAEQ